MHITNRSAPWKFANGSENPYRKQRLQQFFFATGTSLPSCYLASIRRYTDRSTDTQDFTKRKQLGISLTKMYWLLGRKSTLSTNNKLLIYKAILKPIWTYDFQLWGTTSNSNIDILERFQSKVLRLIANPPPPPGTCQIPSFAGTFEYQQ
jgi:hypothetical protein